MWNAVNCDGSIITRERMCCLPGIMTSFHGQSTWILSASPDCALCGKAFPRFDIKFVGKYRCTYSFTYRCKWSRCRFFEAHNHDPGRTICTYKRPIAAPAGGPGDPASGGHRCSHKGDDADDGGGWLPGFFILLCSNSPIEITKSSQSICLILSHIGHPGEEVILNDDGNERSKVLKLWQHLWQGHNKATTTVVTLIRRGDLGHIDSAWSVWYIFVFHPQKTHILFIYLLFSQFNLYPHR